MKHHVMIALGLLMAMIFSYRLANALVRPGVGLSELYLLGGIIIAAVLILAGLQERRQARDETQDSDE